MLWIIIGYSCAELESVKVVSVKQYFSFSYVTQYQNVEYKFATWKS